MSNVPTVSAAFLRFFTITVILWLLVVILGNDIIALWPGEARVLGDLTWSYPIPTLLVRFLRITFADDLFGVRLIGPVLSAGSLLAVFHWGSRLFGRRTALITILVSLSIFLPNLLAKTFHFEQFLLVAQTVFALSLLYYLKTQQGKLWIYGSLLVGAYCSTLSMFLFACALFLLLRYRHPAGKTLGRLSLLPVLGALVVARAGFAYFTLTAPLSSYFATGFSLGEWALLHVLSLLPWFGFALAGLWHLLRRIGKADETVIILSSLLLAALAGGGLFIQTVLALIIARQVGDFFRPGYPYRPVIVFGAVLQLVGFFFLAMYLMMTGFRELGGTGFRVGMALGLVYWIPGVFGVIGLWSKNARLLIGGRVLSGLLVMLVGWLMLYPLVAEQLSLPKPTIERIE